MATLYLFNYNNQFNRVVKRKEKLSEYPINALTSIKLTNTNFNPNNGITTSHIFNISGDVYKTGSPDYCLVCDSLDNIISRWFVTEFDRTRGLQYNAILTRDLAADYKNELLDCAAFIRKGWVNESNPLIFNNENMGFNQIKKGEYPLQNNIHSPWLVLYLARYNGEGQFNTFSGNFVDEPAIVETDYTLDSLTSYKYNYYKDNSYTAYNQEDIYFGTEYRFDDGNSDFYEMTQQFISGEEGFLPKGPTNAPIGYSSKELPEFPVGKVLVGDSSHWNTMLGIFEDGFSSSYTGLPVNSYTTNPVQWYEETVIGPTNIGSIQGYNNLMAENGKTIKVGTKKYRIQINQGSPFANTAVYKIHQGSYLGAEMCGDFFYFNGLEDIPSTVEQNYYVHIPLNMPRLSVSYIELGSSEKIEYNFTYSRSITKDASYEIIAAPFNDVVFTAIPGTAGSFSHSGNVALLWFQNIINKYHGSNFAYDLQLVPYCPVDNYDLSTQSVVYATRGTAKLALAIQLTTSSFSKDITVQNIPYKPNPKYSNETDVYRLVSPNGVGEYEWSPAKNGGVPSRFEVDCTLIPFNPYIKINPFFGGLYGSDFNDYRGLICGGEFSLPIVNSEWETYQLNNVYYQAIFDRNIEHQEINNKYQKINDIVGASLGTLQGGLSGASAGAMVGGPIGAGVGAATGLLTSGITGALDAHINEKLRREDINYQKDRFGYDLGTIKARSQSLSRSTSYNKNNKYFPYVEYYSCTPTELEALENKILFNGMTIEVIGTPRDYLNSNQEYTFLQGDIIEIDIKEDYEIVNELNRRFQGGLRFES